MDMLYLTPDWDLTLDSSRNIALCTNPFSLALAASCACRTFTGDLIYAPAEGIPYFAQVLGQLPPLNDIRSLYVAAAMRVPGVVAAQVFFASFNNRTLSGQLQVTDRTGVITATGF